MSEKEFTKRSSYKLKVSPSSLKLYQECPRKYLFRYIDRLEQKDAEHLRLGKFVHKVLEDFHNFLLNEPGADLASLMTACFKGAIPDFELTKESKVRAHEMLVLYLNSLKKEGLPNVVANEQKFSIDIGDEITVRGIADRIDKDEGGVYAIKDYKSGKSKHLDEFQLLVYGLLLLERDPSLEKFHGTYIVLGEDKRINYRFTRTDIDRVLTKIRKIVGQIREDQTWEPNPSPLCRWCDYEELCPATKTRRQKQKISDDTWLQSDI